MKLFILISIGLLVLFPLVAFAGEPGFPLHDQSSHAWSPYFVGVLIGVLSMLTFYFSDKPLGTSSAYAHLAGILGNITVPKHTKYLKFYQDNKPIVDWEVMLVFGVVIGAFLAAWHGNEFTFEWLPPLWAARFGGESLLLRLGAALVGGIFMGFGARLAGGCTSGHGISGTLQLSVGSWIAVVCFFIGGITTATLMFRP